MGNDVAKNCANRMAIGAMSNVTDLERPVIQRMSEKLSDIAKREGSKDLVTKEEFAEALNGLEISQSDRDILDRIFVLGTVRGVVALLRGIAVSLDVRHSYLEAMRPYAVQALIPLPM